MRKNVKAMIVALLCCFGLTVVVGCNGGNADNSSSTESGSNFETKAIVSFNSNGGSTVDAQEVLIGEKATEPQTTKIGYDFEGWYLGEQKFDFATQTISENIELVAKWIPQTDIIYTIEVYLENFEGGYDRLTENDLGNDIRLTRLGTAGEKIDLTQETQLIVAAMQGVTLNQQDSILQGTINGDGSSVFKVYVNRCSYSLAFVDAEGATVVGAENLIIKYGQTVSLSVFPELFPSEDPNKVPVWKIDGEILTDAFIWTYTQDQVAKMDYVAIPRMVTFMVNGEKYLEKQVESGGKVVAPETVTEKTGYSFVCWKDAEGEIFDFNVAIEADIVLNAYYEPNSYTLKLDLDSSLEGVEDTIQVKYDENLFEALANITKPGHYVSQWVIDDEPITEETIWNWTEEQTAIATWQIESYIVSFMLDGEVVSQKSVVYNKLATAPSIAGYDVAWKLNGETFDLSTPITSSLTLVASRETDLILKQIKVSNGANVYIGGVPYAVEYDADGNFGVTSFQSTGGAGNGSLYASWSFNVTSDDIAVWKSLGYTHITYKVFANTNNGFGNSTPVLSLFNNALDITFGQWAETTATLEEFEAYLGGSSWYFVHWGWVGYEAMILVSPIELATCYTVDFEFNGEKQGEVIVKEGETLAVPSIPGYDVAWQLDNETFDFNTPITEDITLKATSAQATLKKIGFNSGSTMWTGEAWVSIEISDDNYGLITNIAFTGYQNLEANWKFDLTVEDVDAWIAAGYTDMSFTVACAANGNDFELFNGTQYSSGYYENQKISLEVLKTYIAMDASKFVTNPWLATGYFYITNIRVTTSLIVTYEVDGVKQGEISIVPGDTVSAPVVAGYDIVWKLNGEAFDFSTPITESITLTASMEDATLKAIKFKADSITWLGDNWYAMEIGDGSFGFNNTSIGGYNNVDTNWRFDLTVEDVEAWIAAGYTHVTFTVNSGANGNAFTLFDGTSYGSGYYVEQRISLETLKSYIANGTTKFVTNTWIASGYFIISDMTLVK